MLHGSGVTSRHASRDGLPPSILIMGVSDWLLSPERPVREIAAATCPPTVGSDDPNPHRKEGCDARLESCRSAGDTDVPT